MILVAKVAGAFGVRGEVRINAYCEDPMSLVGWRQLFDGAGQPVLVVNTARPVDGGLIARCEGIHDRTAAERLRGRPLFIARSALPALAQSDEFYLVDLIGLRAEAVDGAPLGRVKAVPNFGAGDLLEIKPTNGGPTWYLPFTRETVPVVDIAAGRLTIERPLEVDDGSDEAPA